MPLPHPSGASQWFNVPENKTRLARALDTGEGLDTPERFNVKITNVPVVINNNEAGPVAQHLYRALTDNGAFHDGAFTPTPAPETFRF